MSFYSDFASTATRLLTKYGQIVTFKTAKTYDPVTGAGTGTQTETNTIGLYKQYPDSLIDGTRITASDRLLVIDSSYEPSTDEKVVIGNAEYNIQEVITTSPAGTDVCYFVRIRK